MKVIGAEILTSSYLLDIQPACTRRDVTTWDGKTWRACKDMRCRIYFADASIMDLRIKAGTTSDGSSTPFLVNALIPAVGPNIWAAFFHDEIYRNPDIDLTCGQADDIYYFLALDKGRLAHVGLRIWNFLFKTNPNYKERAK